MVCKRWRHLLCSLLLLGLPVGAVAQQAAPTADWLVYDDRANGFTFRYPPNLKIVKPSLEHMHVPGLVSVVQLWHVGDPKPDLPVLTMTVLACGPGVPCSDDTQVEARLQQRCDGFEQFAVGNAEGFQCVDFGSAACHWSVQVSWKKLRIGIGAPSAAQAVNERTHEREECANGMTTLRTQPPIDSILASFVFTK